VTKPVLLNADGCAAKTASVDSSTQQARSVFYAFTSASVSDPSIPSESDLVFLKADPRDEKLAQINEIRAGSYGWFILLMGGNSQWLEISATTCEKGQTK